MIREILLREGKRDEVLRLLARISPVSGEALPRSQLITLFLRGAPGSQIDAAARAVEARASRNRDSEPKYWVGSLLSYCGRRDAAMRLLRQSVEGGSVNYPAMDHDPQWANVRSDPEFAAIRSFSIENQKRFLAHRARTR